MLKENNSSQVSISAKDIPYDTVIFNLNYLQGKILTIVESAIISEGQLKAVKDLIKSEISDIHGFLSKSAFPSLPMFPVEELKASGIELPKI